MALAGPRRHTTPAPEPSASPGGTRPVYVLGGNQGDVAATLSAATAAGANLRLGVTWASLAQDADAAHVEFTDGGHGSTIVVTMCPDSRRKIWPLQRFQSVAAIQRRAVGRQVARPFAPR